MNTNTDIIRNETAHAINGVPGRLFTLRRPPAPWKAGTFANQTWVSETRPIEGYGTNGVIQVNIRFDDNCKNGHNTFAITADVRTMESRRMKDIAAGGCLDEDIAQIFPELAHLIQWHSCSTDSPMHYVANTLYHASDRDHSGRAAGEPTSFDWGIRFGNSPMTHTLKKRFYDWINAAEECNATALKSNPAYIKFEPVPVPHKKDPGGYDFCDKYTFAGYACAWHECPFDNIREAEEFSAAMLLSHTLVKVPTAWSKGKARDFDAARNCGVWPDATDEQLSAPRAELEAALLARLPALIAAMRTDIEGAGLMWECPAAE